MLKQFIKYFMQFPSNSIDFRIKDNMIKKITVISRFLNISTQLDYNMVVERIEEYPTFYTALFLYFCSSLWVFVSSFPCLHFTMNILYFH